MESDSSDKQTEPIGTRNKSRDLFCKCCTNWFKRQNATFLRPDSEDAIYYQTYGMCTKCFQEANADRLEKTIEAIDLLPENTNILTNQGNLLNAIRKFKTDCENNQ